MYTLFCIFSRPPHHLPPFDRGFDSYTGEHNRHAQPLRFRQLVLEHQDREEHREQLPGHSDHDKSQTAEMLDCLENEQLAQSAQTCECEEWLESRRMREQERYRFPKRRMGDDKWRTGYIGFEMCRERDGQVVKERQGVGREGQDQEWEQEQLRQERHDEHHLLTGESAVGREDLVLCRVGQTVDE